MEKVKASLTDRQSAQTGFYMFWWNNVWHITNESFPIDGLGVNAFISRGLSWISKPQISCGISCLATKQRKLPWELKSWIVWKLWYVCWIASQITHCVKLQGGWNTTPCVRLHNLWKITLKLFSFLYPVDNFTRDSTLLHYQRLWRLWRLWGLMTPF